MVRTGVQLIVFDGRVVEWDFGPGEEDPILEDLPRAEPEPELEPLPERPRPTRRRRSFLSHPRLAA